MSSPKKISNKLWGDRDARLSTATPSTRSQVVDSSNDSIYKLGTSLQGFTRDGDVLILTYPPGVESGTVAFATGVFTPLAKKTVSASLDTLHRSIGLKTGSVLLLETDEANRADIGLARDAIGSIAMLVLDLGLEGSLSVALFKSKSEGRFGPRHVSSLQATCQLAVGFAAAHDPVPPEKLESQIRIDSLENQIRESKEFYDLLIGSIRQCYWVLDLDSRRVLTVSENFEDVWGASRTILTEGGLTGFMSTVHMDDRDHVLSNFHTRLGHSFDQEFRVVASDGEQRWLWLRVNPVEGEVGEVARLVFIADDVTDKKIEEERIRKKETELVSRAMSHFDRKLPVSVTSMADVAREIRKNALERIDFGGVTFDVVIPDESLQAELSCELITQLVSNLVHNSFDAVRSEKEKWIRVEFSADKDSVYVSVTDSGSGIPIKIRSRIFDPFFTTKPSGQGTGLGLSLATSIAAHHHGSLRLDTFSPRTRFVLQLPKCSV